MWNLVSLCLSGVIFCHECTRNDTKVFLLPKHMKEHEKYYCHENTRKITKPRRKPYKNLCEPLCLWVLVALFFATKAHERSRSQNENHIKTFVNLRVFVALFFLPRMHTKWHESFFATKTHERTRKILLPRKHTKEHEDK